MPVRRDFEIQIPGVNHHLSAQRGAALAGLRIRITRRAQHSQLDTDAAAERRVQGGFEGLDAPGGQ